MALASIERIRDILVHPNADSLEICKILWFEVITKKGSFSVGEKVIFITPDSNLPAEASWSQDLLKYCGSNGRVKSIKLRGVWSAGIALKITDVFDEGTTKDLFEGDTEGKDISDLIGVTKYEKPLPEDRSSKGGLPFSIPKTDEERWQNVRDLPFGERCHINLKIDGMSFTAYCVLPGHLPNVDKVSVGICSRNNDLVISDDITNRHIHVARKHRILEKLENFCRDHNVSLALRGEVYGSGVQSGNHNPHSKVPLDLAIFGVYCIADPLLGIRQGKIKITDEFFNFYSVSMMLDVPTVPIVEDDAILTKDLIQKYQDGIDVLPSTGQPFEGVVIHLLDGRSFKVLNSWYDSKK